MKPEEYELLSDPFRSSTQSTKRFLYALSIFSGLVAYTGVMPSTPRVLGFEFPGMTEQLAFWIIFVLSLFTLISFTVYFISDFVGYLYLKDRANLKNAYQIDSEIYTDPYDRDHQEQINEDFQAETGYKPLEISSNVPLILSIVRVFIDGVIPFLFGLTALLWLLHSKLI